MLAQLDVVPRPSHSGPGARVRSVSASLSRRRYSPVYTRPLLSPSRVTQQHRYSASRARSRRSRSRSRSRSHGRGLSQLQPLSPSRPPAESSSRRKEMVDEPRRPGGSSHDQNAGEPTDGDDNDDDSDDDVWDDDDDDDFIPRGRNTATKVGWESCLSHCS